MKNQGLIPQAKQKSKSHKKIGPGFFEIFRDQHWIVLRGGRYLPLSPLTLSPPTTITPALPPPQRVDTILGRPITGCLQNASFLEIQEKEATSEERMSVAANSQAAAGTAFRVFVSTAPGLERALETETLRLLGDV